MVDTTTAANKSVLAVDDEPGVLSALTRLLMGQDYRVTAAPSAEAGLDLVRSGAFSIVLSDNMMPGMKGLEFLAEITRLSPDSRRILVTGYTDLQQAVDAFNHGIVHRYIQKPWDSAALLAIVDAEAELYVQSRAKLEALKAAEGLLKKRSDMIEEALGLLKQAGAAKRRDGHEQTPARKLAAIMHGDVVGFSRMMGTHHEFTLTTLKEYQAAIGDWVAKFNGRVVNAVGDSFLAEFQSAVDAVACAVDLQQEIMRRNGTRPERNPMQFRLGINVGDVLDNGGELFGDGVNVAARVQAIAPPDGICVTDSVYRYVRMRLPFKIESLGIQTLKNIADPVEVYSIVVPERR